MAASQRQWSEEKERQLISFYAEHDYLWNPKAKLYKHRDLKTRDFQTLCQQLSDEQQVITEEDIKKKFKNLRTVFSREHGLVLKSSKSGAGAEEVYLPKWKYYYILSFLRDPCTPEESCDNLSTVLAAPSASQFPEKILSSPSPSPSSPSPSTSTYTPTTPPQRHNAVSEPKKKKMDKAAEAMQYAMGFLKRKASSPHTGFLQYLESCLESLPDNKAKKLKRQIIELAHSVQDEE